MTVTYTEIQELDRLKQEALKFLNAIRGHYGQSDLDELPLGYKLHYGMCPLAKGLKDINNDVGATQTYLRVCEEYYDTPIDVETFVYRFDAGYYPELDEGIGYATVR